MAINKTTPVDPAKIKTRWEEPYTSSAINKEMGAIPRGVYRGFEITEQSTPAAGISVNIKTNEDSVLVHRDYTTGHSTLLRYDYSFDIDFTFDASGSQITLYVWCDINYTVGSRTTGSILIGDSADRGADSITIAKIVIPQSATTILDSYITQDWETPDTMTAPGPNNVDWGFLNSTLFNRFPSADEKDGLSNASPAASASNPYVTEGSTLDKAFAKSVAITKSGLAGTETKFQITGDFYIGKGAQGTAQKWFGLHRITGGEVEPDEYAGDSDSQVYITDIYKNDDSAEVTPSSDADANGFYSNPYLYLSAAIGLTSVAVKCGQETDYAGLDASALIAEADGIRTGASSDISFSVEANSAKRPATITVSADTDSKADFNGATAILDALDYLEGTGSYPQGGTIYVKGGTYANTVSSNLLYGRNYKIICEGDGVSTDSSSPRVTWTITPGTGTFSITFEAGIEISNLKVIPVTQSGGAIRLEFESSVVMSNCRLEAPQYDATQTFLFDGVSGVSCRDCYFNGMVNFNGTCSDILFERCYFSTSDDDQTCISTLASASITNFTLRDCRLDPTKGDTQDGSGFKMGASSAAYGLTIDSCNFRINGEAYAVLADTGIGDQFITISNCYVAIGDDYPTTHVDVFRLSAANRSLVQLLSCYVTVDSGETTGNFAGGLVRIVSTTSNETYIIDGLTFEGNGIRQAHDDTAGYGLITAYLGSGDDNCSVTLRDIHIKNVGPSTTNVREGTVVGVRVYERSSSVVIDNLVIDDLSSESMGNSNFVGIYAASTNYGNLTVKNSKIIGTSLDTGSTHSYTGIYVETGFGGASSDGMCTIADCEIFDFLTNDIYYKDTASTRCVVRNVYGRTSKTLSGGATYARIWMGAALAVVSDCVYLHGGAGATNNQYWLYIANQATLEYVSAHNNVLIMDGSAAGNWGIYAANGVGSPTITGNQVYGAMRFLTADAAIGVGVSGGFQANRVSTMQYT